MVRRLLLVPFRLSEPWVRHPNWMVRRSAQVVALGIAMVWLTLPDGKKAGGDSSEQSDDVLREVLSSRQFLEFLHGPITSTPLLGYICRALALRLSVAAKMHESAGSDDRNFTLRVEGSIDQNVLRNLLIWQNHVLPSYSRQDDGRQADVALVLTSRSDNEPRLFDLLSIMPMLTRFRNFAVFWDEEIAAGAVSALTSQRELSRWREHASDLGNMPREVTRQVDLHGTHGGVKLLPNGRKYANDFLKLALPGRLIVAVALRERDDGTADPDELELWLGLIDPLRAQYPAAAFVILNCLAPSEQRDWPAHIRFARHHGLTLQDAICLAQIADGYLGALDIFGLAAHSAGRPGVYVPLDDRDLPRSERSAENSKDPRIMVGSRNRAHIETAIKTFFADFPPLSHAPKIYLTDVDVAP
jgi:hypothetical protein